MKKQNQNTDIDKWTAKYDISTQSPIFEYTYNGTYHHEQTAQNISYKQLSQNMTQENIYSIYGGIHHGYYY